MKKKPRRLLLPSLICVLVIVAALFAAVLFSWDRIEPVVTYWEQKIQETEPGNEVRQEEPASEAEADMPDMTENESEEQSAEIPGAIPEKTIYTFLQGPKAWKSKRAWSGEWCNMDLADSLFSIFGCGLCDLANIYSTLTAYECSPIDMYNYAIEISTYSPGGGYGAIDWSQMHQVLRKTGFTSRLCKKDATYEAFRDRIRSNLTAIVLVSSYNDDTYWQDTPGHYVNIWNYDEATDTIFLADSGDPNHNRKRVPLKYIYDALASASPHQYLLVTAYDEEKNTWRYTGIHEKWRKPSYYTAKS